MDASSILLPALQGDGDGDASSLTPFTPSPIAPQVRKRFSLGPECDLNDDPGQPLFSSSLITEELDSMNESQLRSTLDEVLLENSALKQQLQNKNRQLKTAKMQVKALLQLEPEEEVMVNRSGQEGTLKIRGGRISDDVENENRPDNDKHHRVPLRILPEHTFILIRGKSISQPRPFSPP